MPRSDQRLLADAPEAASPLPTRIGQYLFGVHTRTPAQWKPGVSPEKIRELNDAFRTTMTGGRFVMTPGIDALSNVHKTLLIERVRTFDEFNAGDDPYGEHDFGSLEFLDRKFCWKIDYDADMKFGSEDPANPSKTTRVLTIMFADEC